MKVSCAATWLPARSGGAERRRLPDCRRETFDDDSGRSSPRRRDFPGCERASIPDGREPLRKQCVRSAWDRLRKYTGMPSVRFRAFRHTAILNLRAAAIEEGTALAISGHRTRAVFDLDGIQPEGTPHEAVKKPETEMRTKDGQSEPVEQALN